MEQQPQYGAASNPGQSLRKLCMIAGGSLMVAAVLYVWAFVAQLLLPVSSLGTAEGVLQYIASYRSFFALSYALFTAANSLSIIGVLGIYAVTRVQNRSYATLGAGTMTVGLIVTLLSSTAPALIRLSDGYSAAATAAEQQAFATAALAVSATNNPLIASALIGVGVIFVSLAMMIGPFGKGLAYVGLVVGALNIVRALPFLAGYSVLTGIVFVGVSSVWIFGVGYRVYKQA
jgi:hypothetical protein